MYDSPHRPLFRHGIEMLEIVGTKKVNINNEFSDENIT